MSNYPYSLDDDVSLPPVNNNLTQIGEDAINSLRDAVFNVETALGINIAGTLPSLADRLGVFINCDGTPNASILNAMGFITLPLYNSQVAAAAGIEESKLQLDYPTANLFNYIRDLSQGVNTAVGWINVSGVKLEPHLMGSIYRHNMTQIDVIETTANYLNNVFDVSRDNINAFLLANDMNNELVSHQWADGSPVPYATADGSMITTIQNIKTNSGTTYPSNYSHLASAIYLNTSGYIAIPPTTNNLQLLANYIDNTSILLLGSRIQNLYANGVSVNSRSSSLLLDGYGNAVVPITPAITYLGGQLGIINNPFDNYQYGDDLLQLMPTASQTSGSVFDAQFALIRTGDKITVGYDGYNLTATYVVLEKKYVDVDGYENYFIRIAGKNLAFDPNAMIRIDRPLFNNNKYGVLSVANGMPVGSSGSSLLGTSISPSLILGNPDGAQCVGVGFNANEIDSHHYLLYLILYPDGNPLDGYTILPGIDITGNGGATPGAYTLDSIVLATNNAFRQPGYNYRFTAFAYQGEFGIIMDPYNNASFSVVNAVVMSGSYDKTATNNQFPNNVIDVFPPTGAPSAFDALGFGPFGAGVASPPYTPTYDATASASGFPTQIFTALQSNNYYVNGAERSTLNTDIYQVPDIYGDGYWIATIYQSTVGSPGQVSVIYTIPLDLQSSQLKAGKTIVVQPYLTNYGIVNYGRFVISAVSFSGCPINTCQITVYDAVHAAGSSPQTIAPNGSQVAIYFSNDSVSFDNETATDNSPVTGTFKRHFEVYTDYNGNAYTHERARIPTSGNITVNNGFTLDSYPTLAQMDIVAISPTLRGAQNGTTNFIHFVFTSLSTETGLYTAYLQNDFSDTNTEGPSNMGRIGEITRFYDLTSIDYIDIIFGFNNPAIADFGSTHWIDVQLFPSLALDQEVMILASCQENTATGTINQIQDLREFGNISTEQLTTSALNFISAGDQLLHFNGVIRGLDAINDNPSGTVYALLSVNGGLALVNGNLVAINDQTFAIPPIYELYNSVQYPINFALCVNDEGELITIALLDYDTTFSTGTPNVGSRVVTVVNAVNGNSYQIDSSFFSRILNVRKDLTPLYIISSVVTGNGTGANTTITTHNVKRLISDSDASIPVVVGNSGIGSISYQGNADNMTVAANWLLFNSSYQNTVLVKGNHTIDTTTVFPSNVQIEGASTDATLTINETVSLSNISFSNLTIQVNTSTGIILGSNISFNNCSFIYNFNALNSVFPVSYNSSDLVNAGYGMIYCGLSGSTQEIIQGVSITNCTFTNNFPDHFPFISIQFTGRNALAQEIDISNNTFISLGTNDLRAVIAFTSTINTFVANEYPVCPQMINVSIKDNVCNQNQLIIITGKPNTSTHYMTNTCISTVNCNISGNTCGTIGYFIQMGEAADTSNTYNNGTSLSISDKFDNLIISGNTCHYIANLDLFANWIEFFGDSAVESVTIQTGQVDIIGNTVSWIHAGTFNGSGVLGLGAGVRITGNKLNPTNPTYLSNYTNLLGDTPDNVGIYLLRGQSTVKSSQSIISENIMVQNPLYTSVGVIVTPYYYYSSAIACGDNVHILNNNITGVVNSIINGTNEGIVILLLAGDESVSFVNANYVVQGNVINRDGTTIGAYIGTLGVTDNIVKGVVITDNVFDSIYTDAANSIFNDVFGMPSLWTYYRNTNQIDYAAIPLYEFDIGQLGGASITIYPISQFNATGGGPGLISQITFAGSPTTGITVNFVGRIGDMLPAGCQLLYATVGLYNDTRSGYSGNITHGSSTSKIYFGLDINITSQITPPLNPSSPVTNVVGLLNTIVDVSNNLLNTPNPISYTYHPLGGILDLTNSAFGVINAINIQNETIFMLIDMGQAAEQVYTGQECESDIWLSFFNLTMENGTQVYVDVSPVVLRYVWG